MLCPECKEEVEPVSISMGTEGIERLRCPNCGAFLEPGGGGETLEEGSEIFFSDESVSVPGFSSIYLVGYPEKTRALIEDQIMQKNLAQKVINLSNGEELIIKLIKNLNSSNGEDMGLVMLEIPMPYLNGINAAIAMRAIERTFEGHNPIPILFLTHKAIDDTFRKVIKFLSPAKYASLGASEEPGQLAPRLNKIISLIAQESWK